MEKTVTYPVVGGGVAHFSPLSVVRGRKLNRAYDATHIDCGYIVDVLVDYDSVKQDLLRYIKLSEFTAPDGSLLFVNVALVAAVISASPTDNSGTNAVLIVAGRHQAVRETVDEVKAKLSNP